MTSASTSHPERLKLIRVASGDNQFLRAQQAFFLTDIGANDVWDTSGPTDIGDVLIDRYGAHSHHGSFRNRTSILTFPVWKYVIPTSAAPEILSRLDVEGVTSLRLQPSLRDVMDSLDLEIQLPYDFSIPAANPRPSTTP